jgi:hypothetical protein
MKMRRLVALTWTSLVFMPLGHAGSSTANEGPVWFLNVGCQDDGIAIEVRLDAATVYRHEFWMCRTLRSAVRDGGADVKIEFSITPKKPITWSGYQDNDVTSPAGQALDVDLWQAGADPNDLLIGVSVADKSQTYMNTIHIAYPHKTNSTTIAPGLVVTTHPVKVPRFQ